MATVTVIVSAAGGTKFFVVDDTSDATFEYGTSGQFIEQTVLANGNWEPRGVTSNATGSSVWVVDAGGTVFVYDGDGNPQGSWIADAANAAEGIATDGTDIWIVDGGSKKLLHYQGAATLTSGNMRPTSRTGLGGQSNVKGVTTDGTSIWIVDDGATTDTVLKYATDATLLGSWVIDGDNATPTGITINPAGGNDLWIINAGSNEIFEYRDDAALRITGSQSANVRYALDSDNTNPQGIADPIPRRSEANGNVTDHVNAAVISTDGPRRDAMPYRVAAEEAFERLTLPNTWAAGFPQARMTAGDELATITSSGNVGTSRTGRFHCVESNSSVDAWARGRPY